MSERVKTNRLEKLYYESLRIEIKCYVIEKMRGERKRERAS